MIASGKVRDAFDVDKEPAKIRTFYGDQPVRVINQPQYALDNRDLVAGLL